MSEKLSHIDEKGNPSMVNVGQKVSTLRKAVAQALVHLPEEVMAAIKENELQLKKGPVFQTAVLAGIMAAKKTGELIPLCHPLGLDHVSIEIKVQDEKHIIIRGRAELNAKTGVEMEALTAVSVAALTVYDMCKALSHDIEIKSIKLMEKTGGKRDFKR